MFFLIFLPIFIIIHFFFQMIRLAVHVGVIIIYWFAIQNVLTKSIPGVDISVTSSAHTTPSQTTPITTTTPRMPTTTPNCLIDGTRYPANREVSRGYDASTNWCYGSFVDENCNMIMWDTWNCRSSTTTSTTTTTTTTPDISPSTPQTISTTTTNNPKKRKNKQKKRQRKLRKMKRQKIIMIWKMKMQKKWRKQQKKKIQLKRKMIKKWKMMMKRKMQRKKLSMKNKVD